MREDFNMISYKKLWETLEERKMSQYDLLKNGVDKRVLDYLRHNKNITLLTLENICRVVGCKPNDVVEFLDEENIKTL